MLVRLTRGLVVLNVWRLPKLTQNSRHFFFYEKDKEKHKLLNGNDLSDVAFLGIAVLFRDSILYIKRLVSLNTGNNFKSVQLEEEKAFWI